MENGDKPKTLSGSSITIVDKFNTTYHALRDFKETELSLVVSRCSPACGDPEDEVAA